MVDLLLMRILFREIQTRPYLHFKDAQRDFWKHKRLYNANVLYRFDRIRCGCRMRVRKTKIRKEGSEWKWFRRRELLSCFMKRVTKELEIRGNRVKVYYKVGFSSVYLVFMSSDSWSFVYFKKSCILADLSNNVAVNHRWIKLAT